MGRRRARSRNARWPRRSGPGPKSHDPDEIMDAPFQLAGRSIRICTYPLGHDSGTGLLSAGFAHDGSEPLPPTALQRTLLNIAANQAITAYRNIALHLQAEAARSEAQALYDVSRVLAAELDLADDPAIDHRRGHPAHRGEVWRVLPQRRQRERGVVSAVHAFRRVEGSVRAVRHAPQHASLRTHLPREGSCPGRRHSERSSVRKARAAPRSAEGAPSRPQLPRRARPLPDR